MGDTETEYHSEEDESSDDEAIAFDNLPTRGQVVQQPQRASTPPPLPAAPTGELTKQVESHRQALVEDEDEDEESGDEFQDVDPETEPEADAEPEPEPVPEPAPAPPPPAVVMSKGPAAPVVTHVKSAPQVRAPHPQQPATPERPVSQPVSQPATPEPNGNDHHNNHQRISRRSNSVSRPKLPINDLMNKIFMVASSGGGQSARISDLVVAIRTSVYVRDLKQSVELTEEEGAFLMFTNTLSIDDHQKINYSEFMRMEIFSDKEGVEEEEEETADSTSSSSTPPRHRRRVVTPARGSTISSPSKTRTPVSSARRLGPPRVAGLAKPALKTHPRTVTSMASIRSAQSEAKKRALRMMRRTEQEAVHRIEEIQKREKRASAVRRSTSNQINEKLANYERAVSASIQPERSLSPSGTRRVLLSPQPDAETDTFLSLLRDRLSPPATDSLETPLSGATTEVICLQTFISQQRDTIQSLEDKLASTDGIIRKLEKREQKALKRERRAVAQQTHLENKLLQMSNPEVLKRLLGKQEDLNGSFESRPSQPETPIKQVAPSKEVPTPQPEQVVVHVPTGITEADVKKRVSEATKALKEKHTTLKTQQTNVEAKLSARIQDLQTQSETATKKAQEQTAELTAKTKRIKELETQIKKQHTMLTEADTELRAAINDRDNAREGFMRLQASVKQAEESQPSCSVCGESGVRLEKRKSGALKCKKCIGKQRKK
eukprot:TRINITY_DN3450_c0_g3_i1.p1 TRINITY_DN3450_c0_g3~~TRINITY_DN3450_c0_g3_i1.p1  ORF type:complete len:720 (+),score=154.01 TRINITY_DN3450_c0_g3_i1:47-2206(+)